MNHLDVLRRLSDRITPASFSEHEIKECSEIARSLFNNLCEEVFSIIEGDNRISSPGSRDFLSQQGGILLFQGEMGSIIIQIINESDGTKSLVWTPRNIITVALEGVVNAELFSLGEECKNEEFKSGLRLGPSGSRTLGRSDGMFQSRTQVQRLIPARTGEKAVVVSFFGTPLDPLDWIFDSDLCAASVAFARQRDSDVEQTIETFLEISEHEEVSFPLEAARRLARDDCYRVRWSALRLLWQTGNCDSEVLDLVQSDRHPEISNKYAELVESCGDA